VSYRFCFALLRYAADPGLRSKETCAGDSRRLFRHRGHVVKMSFAGLLSAACLVESDSLDHGGIVKVCHWWIVERDVTVFPKAHEGEVDRRCFQQFGIAIHLRVQI